MKPIVIYTFLAACQLMYGVFAQTKGIRLEGDIQDENGPLGSVTILIYNDARLIRTLGTDAEGQYATDLEFNKNYFISFGKAGYVSKHIQIYTTGVKRPNDYTPLKARLVLFKPVDGVDYSVLSQPILKYAYNAQLDIFEYDKLHYESMQAQLNVIYETEQKIRDADAYYEKAIKNGDRAFLKKDWLNALGYYKEAANYKANQPYPEQRIYEITLILKQQPKSNDPELGQKYTTDSSLIKPKVQSEITKSNKKPSTKNVKSQIKTSVKINSGKQILQHADSLMTKKKTMDAMIMYQAINPDSVQKDSIQIRMKEAQASLRTKNKHISDLDFEQFVALSARGIYEEYKQNETYTSFKSYIIRDNVINVYVKTAFAWGQIKCTRNGQDISYYTYEIETQDR